MSWVDVAFVFVVCHLVGDYLFQTDWQARHKHGGLTLHRTEARRALFEHTATYTLAFVPALVWIATTADLGVLAAVGIAALVFIPHFLQDDGRVVKWWMIDIKHTDWQKVPGVTVMVDQTLHLVMLFLLAILIALAT